MEKCLSCESLKRERDQLINNLRQANDLTDHWMSEHGKLSAQLAACTNQRDELELNESKMNGALSAKQEIIETLTAERDELRDKFGSSGYGDEKTQMERELQMATGRAEKAEKDAKHFEFCQHQVTQDRDNLATEVKDLQADNLKLQVKIEKLEAANKVLEEALELLRDNRMHDSRVTEVCREALARAASIKGGGDE
jgi:chromosome segregation ATPase